MGTGHDLGPGDPSPADPVAASRRAVQHLVTALARVGTVCEQSAEARSNETGLNLPQALSYALGLAAQSLGLGPGPIEAEENRNDTATEGLVRHRSGSWEPAAVRPLVFPVAWLPDPTGPDHTGVEL
jgi:hypothetical protein